MKRFALVLLLTALVFVLAGCNRPLIDTTWTFDYVYIKLPNGETVEGKVESWRDYEDGDQLQVRIAGKTYLTHAANVVLVAGGYVKTLDNAIRIR